MKEFHPGQTNAVVMAGMGTAVAVVLSMLGLYIPLFSTLIFLAIPLPIIYIAITQGSRWAVIVTVGTLILDSVFFGVFSGAFVCAIFGVLGVILGICFRHHVWPVGTLLAGAVGVLIAFGAQVFFGIYVMGVDTSMLSSEFFDTMKQSTEEMLPQFYSGDTLTQMQEQVALMYDALKKSVIFVVGAAAIVYSWAAMALAKYIFHRMGIKDIPSLPSIDRWEFPRFFVYFYLVVIAAMYVYKELGLSEEMMNYIDIAIYNLQLVCLFPFWLQGLSFIWWLPVRYPSFRSFRWIILVGAFFLPFIQSGMIVAGLFDLLFYYRKKHNYK